MSANNKEEFLAVVDRFVTPQLTEKPMLLEVFTTNEDESDSLKIMRSLCTNSTGLVRNAVRNIIGQKGVNVAKKILGK